MHRLKRLLKILLYLLIFLVLAVAGSYLLLQQRSKRLLRYAVEVLSDGQYTAKSARVRVSLFPVYVDIDRLRVQPVDSTTMPKYVLLEADSVRLRINNIMGLVNYRKLDVELLTVYNPSFTSVFEEEEQKEKRPFNEAIKDLQKGFVDVLEELKVKNCSIVDGAIRIVPAGNPLRSFSLNHLFLTLEGIQLSENVKQPGWLQINGLVTLELRRPTLKLPGEGMEGALNYLRGSSATHTMDIDSLRFWHHQPGGLTDSAILSSIRLKQLHWDSFIDRGIMEIDSAYVARGIINLGILRQKADEPTDADTTAGNRGYLGQQFHLHHVEINDISYGLRAVDTVGNKGTANLELRGDRLQLHELTLLQDRLPALDIEDLTLQIRDFKENNLSTGISSTLGALEIRNRTAELRNIRFRKEPAIPGGLPTVLDLPILRLEGYVLSQVFLQRYKARRVVLVSPSFTGDIGGNKTGGGQRPKRSIADITELLRGKVDVQELSIENLSAVLNPSAPEAEQIVISGLDADLDARQLLQAQNYRDIIRSLVSLRSGKLQLTARETRLALRGLTIDKEKLALHLDTITGKLPGNIGVQLQDVLVQAKPLEQQMDPANNVFDFRGITIGNGLLNMPAPHKGPAPGSRPAGTGFLLHTDSFLLRRLDLRISGPTATMASATLNTAATNLTAKKGSITWDELTLGSSMGWWRNSQVQLGYGSLSLQQPGTIRVNNVSLRLPQNADTMMLAAPQLQIEVGINEVLPQRLAIKKFTITEPEIRVVKRGTPKSDAAHTTTAARKPLPPVTLDELRIIKPHIDLKLETAKGPLNVQSQGGEVLLQGLTLPQGDLVNGASFTRIKMDMPALQLHTNHLHLQPQYVGLTASNGAVDANGQLTLNVDELLVRGAGYSNISENDDTMRVWVNEAGLRQIPINTASLPTWKQVAAGSQWWIKGLDFEKRNPTSLFSVSNAILSAKDRTVAMDSLIWRPAMNRETFWQQFPFQKTWLAVSTGRIAASLGSMERMIHDTLAEVKSLQVNNLNLHAQRNKTYPEDTVRYRPLPAQHLLQIPVGFKIDSLLFNNGYVRSTTIAEKSGREGNIYFSGLRGSIINVKNREVVAGDSLRLRAAALLMDSGRLNMQFSQSYTDSLQTFLMQARMQQFNLVRLDSLLNPLLNIQIKSGNITSMRLQAKGNDMLAFGNMDLRYNHLKLNLLDKEGKSRYLFSNLLNGLANALVANKDNGRSDVVYAERKREKAIFNFWSGIAISGFLTNLGIKKDKKQIKKYKRQAKRLQLPDYTEE